MALPLRYLVRRALQQRALVPRVPPSARSRPRGSSPRQGLRTNESGAGGAAAASKGNKEPELLGSQKLASIYNKVAIEDGAIHNFVFVMGYAALGAGVAFLRDCYDVRNEKTIITLEFEGI